MTTDPADAVFAALADPTRRAILARLATGEATVSELAAPFPISVQAISKHLAVLERAGLIVRTREAQWRRCRLDSAPLRTLAEWVDQYRRLWDDRYDTLDDYLRDLKETHHEQAP
ncbi:ArsR/SmtB family transcription factor [Micromonospora parathelypteridis]|uniref:DNA-binding transcriptional ArsR family regulator n=1 Tax=Micromonospora parathelypteridis TaxID=1839617 RepID=A0A840VWN9_9ACTN|nr:metalloregulator ArsR/SmtB family transcription factor [Micromonospora parathelypteridis]MBB5481135.1 DNA-binding transcriptional ArsR family regulator [Micromonospora parathelypteridis]GGO19915.1 transcriptional regulator [Micromonospora parathelypteridis]